MPQLAHFTAGNLRALGLCVTAVAAFLGSCEGFALEHARRIEAGWKNFLPSAQTYVTRGNTTMRNATQSHDPSDLGDLEREVLQLVWQHREITADGVREALDRSLKDSTVRTVLRRLEEKGYLAHAVENRTFLYRPAETRQRSGGAGRQTNCRLVLRRVGRRSAGGARGYQGS